MDAGTSHVDDTASRSRREVGSRRLRRYAAVAQGRRV